MATETARWASNSVSTGGLSITQRLPEEDHLKFEVIDSRPRARVIVATWDEEDGTG
jgi:hypothetical protein